MMGIFSSIKEKITGYIDIQTRLIRLKLIEQSARLLGTFIFGILVLFLMFCVILFLGFGLSEVFVDIGCTRLASYFIVTGIYILVLVLILVLRKPITRFFANDIILVMTEKDERKREEKEDEDD